MTLQLANWKGRGEVMTTRIILVPRRYINRDTAEMVEIRDINNYPRGIVHIDAFWHDDFNENSLYKKLMYNDNPIIIELSEIEDGK